MELHEFNSMSDQAKAEYLWQHGKHLVSLRENEYSYLLYRTPDFYLEIELSDSLQYGIKAFKTEALLDKYIDWVNLENLIN